MLSERLQRASVIELGKFLKRKRENPLTEKKITEIQNLIKKREKENEIFADKLVKNRLYKLACVQLKREGKAKKYMFGGQERYECEPLDVILTMRKIIITAEQKGIQL